MAHKTDISKTDISKIKVELNRLTTEAERSADTINKGPIIPNCNVYDLAHLIGDTDRAHAVAVVMHELFPEDSDIRRFWDKTYDINSSAYKGRNRFVNECECKKKA